MNSAAATPQVATPLGSLSGAVQRVNTLTVNVTNFLERFHGPQPETAEIDKPDHQPCHSVTLDRLFGAIERLEGAVAALDNIG